VLRNGDNRFLPLLLAKVNDVLPRLVNPMLQTVPDTPATMCADLDIFDGFGNAGMGTASNFPGYNGNGTSGGGSEFKMEPEQDYTRNNIASMPPYDKRIEELGSPINHREAGANSPFDSPPIMQSPMEYPGFNDFSSFPELNSPGMGSNLSSSMTSSNQRSNFSDAGGRSVDFKREFDGHMGMMGARPGSIESMGVRRPPLRQNSGSSFGIPIPRSIPEQYGGLQRASSGGVMDMGMGVRGGGELPFR
jgi:hypothetical protein